MKTIVARFQELKKDLDEVEVDGEIVDANKVEIALHSIGVSLRDELTGQFRDLDDVFLELSSKWDTLDRNTQRYIATVAAGSRQQSRFIAMMDNYDRTLELVNAAQNSSGASAEQFAKTLDSVETKINNLRSSFEEFIGTTIQSSFVKDLLDGINTILQFINDVADQGGVALTAFAAAAIIVIKQIINNFVSGLKTTSGLLSATRERFLGDTLSKMKETNRQAIQDLEAQIRNGGIAQSLSQQIATGINNGANQARGGAIVTQGQKTTLDANYLNRIKRALSNKQTLSSEELNTLSSQGIAGNNRKELLANISIYEKQNNLLNQNNSILANNSTSVSKFNTILNQVGPTISSIGSMLASLATAGIIAGAATKGTVALGGATTGTMVGGLVGSLGYAIPGLGLVLGPLFQALGSTLGALIGEGISTGLDNAKYGIGSQESIKKFQEQAVAVAEQTSQSIEENQKLIELGEEYLSLSEKINLTNEEKERLVELNEQLIEQWDGLEYINSTEGELRSINIDQLKEEIKLKKQLIAEDTAWTNLTQAQSEYAQKSREITDSRAASEEALAKAADEARHSLKNIDQETLDIINEAFGYEELPHTMESIDSSVYSPEQFFYNTLTSLDATPELLEEKQQEIVSAIENLETDNSDFSKAVENYINQISSGDEQLDKIIGENLDKDIESILDAAFSGVSTDSFAYQNRNYLSELLKTENVFSSEEIDKIASGELDLDTVLQRRTEIAEGFIKDLNSFNEKEQETFSNAISMIGLFRNEKGEADSQRIIEYIESELGPVSNSVKEAFNEIFKVQSETLANNWDSLLGDNQKKIDEIADSFETGGAEIAAAFSQMTISAGDQAPAFMYAFQDQFEQLLDKYAPKGENGRVINESTREEFEAILDALSSTDVTSANSIAKLQTELKNLGMTEEEVYDLTSSLGPIFERSGLTAEEALSDIEAQLEKVNSLIDIIGANLDGSLSLSQLDEFNSLLDDMGMKLLDASQVVATGEGFRIQGDVGGIISSGTEGQRDYLLNMANQANAAKFLHEQMAELAATEEERVQHLEQAQEQQKVALYYQAAEAQIRANTIKQSMEAENEEQQRLYNLIQQYKDMIAEMERYYNLQRKILQLQNEQADLELDFDLAEGSAQTAEVLRGQILNLTEQQALLRQAGDIYSRDLKELGDYINSSFGQFLTVDETGNIFQNTDELVKLAEKMKGASEEESEELQKQWDTIAEVQSAYEDLYDTAISNSQEYKQNLIEQRELEQQILEYQIELEQTLRDIVIAEMQAEVEAVKEKYNKIKDEDQKYLSSLQKSINKRKQMQSDQKQDEEIQALQNRIGLLSRDTSGIYTKEIEDLQEELDQLLQEKSNTALDRMYEEEESKTQKIADELTLRSEYLQNQLDLELETYAISNQKVAELLKLKDEEILNWMMQHSADFRKATTAEQENFILTWETQIERGKAAQQTLTDDLEQQKIAILTKFQEIKTGGIDVYIAAVDEANSHKIVLDVNTDDIDVALTKLENLENKQNEFVKNEARRQLDTLMTQIESAYAAGNNEEGERLKAQYQNYMNLYSQYGGDVSNDFNTPQGTNYSQALKSAQTKGENAFKNAQSSGGSGTTKSLVGTMWSANSNNTIMNFYNPSKYNELLGQWATNNDNNGRLGSLEVIGETEEWVQVVSPGWHDIRNSKLRIDLPGVVSGPLLTGSYFSAAVRKSDLQRLYSRYATGGIVDYTGPAWVDGTPSKPEAFLSASDTENIAKLRDILSKAFNSSKSSSVDYSQNQNTGDTYYEFHITVDELRDGYNAEDMMKDMEKYILQKSNYRNVINIGKRK